MENENVIIRYVLSAIVIKATIFAILTAISFVLMKRISEMSMIKLFLAIICMLSLVLFINTSVKLTKGYGVFLTIKHDELLYSYFFGGYWLEKSVHINFNDIKEIEIINGFFSEKIVMLLNTDVRYVIPVKDVECGANEVKQIILKHKKVYDDKKSK